MKPYIHELSIRVRFFQDQTYAAKYIGQSDYTVSLDYVRNPDSGSNENIITISDLLIPPQAELIITFGVKKSMIQFEEYVNDCQRGFNIMHMPILYREFDPKTKKVNEASAEGIEEVNVQAALPWKAIESAAMLVIIPEPDFSMPFNVNAVTLGILGVFMINMYNSLVKPKRFLD